MAESDLETWQLFLITFKYLKCFMEVGGKIFLGHGELTCPR